jgi:16S rRNA processing protein RimM
VPSEAFVIVGKLGRSRGVQGEIYVTPETDFPQRFVGLKEIYVKDRNRWEKRSLISSQLISGRPVLLFKDITTPEEAARLTNRALAVPRSQAVVLPDDTYFIFDLIGCEVLEEKTDRLIGQVVDIERYPANDVYVMKSDSGEILRCPAVKRFIRKVDIQRRKITVDTAGLLKEETS